MVVRSRRIVRVALAVMVLPAMAACVTWVFFVRPNASTVRSVVLISIDTCRADHLSCYGFDRQTTPNIDTVAKQGTLFTRAHSTNSSTLPAHSSMLTGTNPPYHGVHDNKNYRLGDDNVSLAEILCEQGYRTAAFVSTFVLKAQFGLDQGFETYDDQVTGAEGKLFVNERKAGATNQRALDWLDDHGQEPFFLFLHYFDPHTSYSPPEPFASRYSDAPYAGEIAYTDHCIGQVIEKLKSLGIYDSTLLVITSDHAESLGEHGEPTHTYFIYQSTIHVPLIIKAPGCAPQQIHEGLVSIVDVAPTVLGLLGITGPPQIQGRDISRILFTAADPASRFLFCESLYPTKYGCSGLFGLIHDRWKFISTTQSELYDLLSDPGETTNLIDQQTEVADAMRVKLEDLLLEQTRTDVANSTQQLDHESTERLKSLGYVGGDVNATSLAADPKGEDPKDFIDFHNSLMKSRALIRNKRLDEARLQCLEMLKMKPRDLSTIRTMGWIADLQGRNADAVSYYSQYLAVVAEVIDSSPQETILQLNYDIIKVHISLGIALQRLSSNEKAIAHFQEALRIEPDNALAHNNLGISLANLGRFQDAMESFQQAVQIKPDYKQARDNLRRVEAHLQRNDDSPES